MAHKDDALLLVESWRHAESFPRYPRILVLDRQLFERAKRDGNHVAVLSDDPFIAVADTGGKSVVRLCQDLGYDVRAYELPAGSDVQTQQISAQSRQ